MSSTTSFPEAALDEHFRRMAEAVGAALDARLVFDDEGRLLGASGLDPEHFQTKEIPQMTTPVPSFSLPYTATDADGDALKISSSPELGIARGAEGSLVNMTTTGTGSIGVFVSKEEAPRVALAILISAGHNPDAHGNAVESAAAALASIQAREERRVKLEGEALELANARRNVLGYTPRKSFGEIEPPEAREAWLQVAKAARKLAAREAAK